MVNLAFDLCFMSDQAAWSDVGAEASENNLFKVCSSDVVTVFPAPSEGRANWPGAVRARSGWGRELRCRHVRLQYENGVPRQDAADHLPTIFSSQDD
jgi:hypothetical protein